MPIYYVFGAPLPGRTGSANTYRYGFNGKENDAETGTQDYGFRIYNPSLGKFLSVDPLTKSYPMLTPYQFASNTPIQAIDLDGLEAEIVHLTKAIGQTMLDLPKTEAEARNAFAGHFASNVWSHMKYPVMVIGFMVAGPVELVFLIPAAGLTVGKDIASTDPEKFPGAATAPNTGTGAVFHIFDEPGKYEWQSLGDIADASTWAISGVNNPATSLPEYVDFAADNAGVIQNTVDAGELMKSSNISTPSTQSSAPSTGNVGGASPAGKFSSAPSTSNFDDVSPSLENPEALTTKFLNKLTSRIFNKTGMFKLFLGGQYNSE